MDGTRSWVPELVAVGVFAVAGVWWSHRGNPTLVMSAAVVAVALYVWRRPSVRRRGALCAVLVAAAVAVVVPSTQPLVPIVVDPISPALAETGVERTSILVLAVREDPALGQFLTPGQVHIQGQVHTQGSDAQLWNSAEFPSAREVTNRLIHDLWDVRPTLLVLLGAVAVLSLVPVLPRRRRNGRNVGVLVGCAAAVTCGLVVIVDDLMAYQEQGVSPIGWLPLRDAALHAVPPVLVIAAAAALVLGGMRRGREGMRVAGAATLMLVPAFLAKGVLAGAGMHPTHPVVWAGAVHLMPMDEPVPPDAVSSIVTFASFIGLGLLILVCATALDRRVVTLG
jgi:hypothetical protein